MRELARNFVLAEVAPAFVGVRTPVVTSSEEVAEEPIVYIDPLFKFDDNRPGEYEWPGSRSATQDFSDWVGLLGVRLWRLPAHVGWWYYD